MPASKSSYILVQPVIKLLALVGFLGHYLFYYLLGQFTSYQENLLLRTVCAFLFLSWLIIPRKTVWKKGHVLLFEISLQVVFPLAFTYFLLINNVNTYWFSSLVFSALLLGVFSKVKYCAIGYPLGAVIASAIYFYLGQGTIETLKLSLQAHLVSYFLVFITKIIISFFEDTYQQLRVLKQREARKNHFMDSFMNIAAKMHHYKTLDDIYKYVLSQLHNLYPENGFGLILTANNEDNFLSSNSVNLNQNQWQQIEEAHKKFLRDFDVMDSQLQTDKLPIQFGEDKWSMLLGKFSVQRMEDKDQYYLQVYVLGEIDRDFYSPLLIFKEQLVGLTRIIKQSEMLGLAEKLAKAHRRLNLIFNCTKDMAVKHERIEVAKEAANVLTNELPSLQESSVIFYSKDNKGYSTYILKGEPERKEDILSKLEELSPVESIVTDNKLIVPVAWGNDEMGYLNFPSNSIHQLVAEDKEFVDTISYSLGLSLSNIGYIEQMRVRAKMETDMDAAKMVQESFFPKKIPLPNLNMKVSCLMADKTGGDWYHYYYHEDKDILDIFLGDVTGHGIPAALMTGVAFGSILTSEYHKESQKLSGQSHLHSIVQALHHSFQNANRKDMSLCILSLNLKTGMLEYLNAGHLPLNWYQKEEKKVQGIFNRSFILGSKSVKSLDEPEKAGWSIKSFQLEEGDRICLYSDGLIENYKEGNKPLNSMIIKKMIEDGSDIDSLHTAILDKAEEHMGSDNLKDDVTLILLEWVPEFSQSV